MRSRWRTAFARRWAGALPGLPAWLAVLTGLALPCAAIAATQSTSGSSPPVAPGAGLTTDAGSWASSAMCAPPASGSTCGGGGPASQGDVAGGGVDVGAGNPINLTNGNKHQTEIDLAALPGVLGLEIVRHYNSASSKVRGRNGLFGRGWRSSYETTLHPAADAIRIVQADGARLRFDCAPNGTQRCRSDDPAQGFVDRRTTPDGEVFTWHWSHGDAAGRQLHFDRAGRLTRIAAPSGEFVSLLYDPQGSLRKVVDPQGRALEFHYPERRHARAEGWHAGVERIVSPTGTFRYRYGTAPLPGEDAAVPKARRLALIEVAGPGEGDAAPLRRYHYEDPQHPTLLTGISIEARSGDGRRTSRRLATYGYDAAGRGILSAPGDAAAEVVTSAGSTNRLVRLDFRTRPRRGFPGTTVLTTADGTSTTYTVGLVADTYRLLEARGPGCPRCSPGNMRYRYDGAGRLTEATALGTVSGQPIHSLRIARDGLGRVQRIDKLIHVRGKPGVPRLVKRYEYAGEEAWPAVVAIPSIVDGREHRLSLRYNAQGQIVEMRESGYAPLDEHGEPVAGGSPIERTTTLRYARINGRSLLVEVDGPFPNGSTASPADSDIMRLHHDEGGNRVESITHPMNLQERFEHDAAGRVVAHTPTDGVTVRHALDALGQPVRWQRGEASVDVDRDGFGRPSRITLPDGEILHLGHDGPDGLAAMVSNLGRGWWLRDAAAHPMPRRSRPFMEAVAATRGRHAAPSTEAGDWAGLRRWIDDFGRMQALRTDATGLEHFRYDAAGRLVERRFADGWTWRWMRDAAGRIVAHSVSAHGSADALTTSLRYAGPHLVRIEHATQIETRTHDAMGRIRSRTIERPASSPGITAVRYREAYVYDAADRVTRHELPEGGELHYEWGRGAQLRGIAWLDALRRRTPLLAPLPSPSLTMVPGAAHVAKPARPTGGYRFGNGTEVRFSLGGDARLSELLHVLPQQPSAPEWPVWIAHAYANGSTPPVGTPGDSVDPASELIAGWRYDYDAAGRMAQRTDARLSVPTAFAFDRHARVIAAQPGIDSDRAEYYAYDATGTIVGRRREAITEDFREDTLVRSAGGLPRQIGRYRLRYSADRRLAEVHETTRGGPRDASERIVARYAHDALGQRIRKTVFSAGNESLAAARSTQFLWDSYRLVGEVAEEQGPPRLKRRYVYAHGVPVASVDYPAGRQLATQGAPLSEALRAFRELLGGTAPQVRYIHANEIGTPTAVTDDSGRVVWRAAHTLYGEARVTAAAVGNGHFRLNLRLPGQYHDAETGWHDNVLRTYDPRRGQYLEPDPLGPHPLTRPYAYAANDPLRYADPLGLILFAFDGTGNNESSRTNVYWLMDAYDDNDTGLVAGSDRPYYMEGVGTKWYLLGDDALAYTLKPKVEEQLTSLDSYVRAKFDHETRVLGKPVNPASPLLITLDVIGFSRGAAAARDFVNEVIARRNQAYYRDLVGGACVGIQIRFLGLFDTVLSQQINGTISLGIPASQIGQVAHAVAANEHRALFPLESAEPAYGDRGANIVERSFVGAHADIGGGYTVEDGGDLSDVALNWMHQQAVAAGVGMKALQPDQRAIKMPIAHDESKVTPWNVAPFNGRTDDREVRYPDQVQLQRGTDFEGMNHAESLAYIVPDPVETPLPNHYQDGIAPTPAASNRIGLVDMVRYQDWLARNYGLSFDEENKFEPTSIH